MPQYLFKHPDKEEYKEIFFGMNDEKKYVDESGVKWERRWTVPNASIDSLSAIDPFDTKRLAAKTGQKKGSLGDLWSLSKEASERRADKIGTEDPIKRKFLDNYQKENKVKHWHDRPQKIENKHAVIDFNAKSE